MNLIPLIATTIVELLTQVLVWDTIVSILLTIIAMPIWTIRIGTHIVMFQIYIIHLTIDILLIAQLCHIFTAICIRMTIIIPPQGGLIKKVIDGPAIIGIIISIIILLITLRLLFHMNMKLKG